MHVVLTSWVVNWAHGWLEGVGFDMSKAQLNRIYREVSGNIVHFVRTLKDGIGSGGDFGGGPASVPELDGSMIGFAMVLVLGGMLVIQSRRRVHR